MRMLCIGPLWRGSNAGGLFKALSRRKVVLDVVDEFYYLSLKGSSNISKLIYKLIRRHQINEFNEAIRNQIEIFTPDVLFVYKGAFLFPETLAFARNNGSKLVNFYPDVSIYTHGMLLPQTLPMYDQIFTTKTFGINDLGKIGVKRIEFLPHGFDPEVHRILDLRGIDVSQFECEVSFIGTWSPKKEKYLNTLKSELPDLNLKIWGDQWEKSQSLKLVGAIMHRSILGDLYAMAIQCSKINIALLSERVGGASSGDLITSRTFHIPACGGFMLHERTKESVTYFLEDKEAVFFGDMDEMINKVKMYLQNDTARKQIQDLGYVRSIGEHSLDHRANDVINRISNG